MRNPASTRPQHSEICLAALSRQNNGQAQKNEEAVRAAQSLRFIRGLFRALYGEHPIFFEEVFSNEDERRKIKSHVDN